MGQLFLFNATISDKFQAFHEENPRVYAELVSLARKARAKRPNQKIGIGMLYEVLRWNVYLRTQGDEYKLNNDWWSRYARLIEEREPDLRNAFETRALRSD